MNMSKGTGIKKITPTRTAGATTKKLSYENKNFFSGKIDRAILGEFGEIHPIF